MIVLGFRLMAKDLVYSFSDMPVLSLEANSISLYTFAFTICLSIPLVTKFLPPLLAVAISSIYVNRLLPVCSSSIVEELLKAAPLSALPIAACAGVAAAFTSGIRDRTFNVSSRA